jgi:hypothetical protein
VRTSITFGGVTLTRTRSGAIHLSTSSGTEAWLSPREAVDLFGALNALPDVAHAWLRGGGR